MAVVAFIEPPQAEVIEKILRHCGLWRSSAARAPPANANGDAIDRARRSDSEPNELTYVDIEGAKTKGETDPQLMKTPPGLFDGSV